MTMEALVQQLEDSFADYRLSDSERRDFIAALRDSSPPEDGLRRLRNLAFEHVRAQQEPQQQHAALQWLEGVMRSLDAVRTPLQALENHAFFSPGTACRTAIVERIKGARSQLDVCVFTISDDTIAQAIVDAHQRGVAVRVLTDDDKSQDQGSDVDWLRNAGVPLAMDRSSAHMHHKFALIDARWLINGSYNWTRSAATSNEENLVVSNDPDLLRQFQAQFDSLWQRWAP